VTDLLALLAGFAVGALAIVALLNLRRGSQPVARAAGPVHQPGAAPPPAAYPPPAAPPPAADHAIRVNRPPVEPPTAPRPAVAAPVAAAAAPPGAPGQARLALEDGSARVDLGTEPVTLGRGTDQSLRIPDSRASRAHAVVRPRAKGGWELVDNGSANGTELNGHRIPDGRVAPLRDGDRIGIGPITVLYTESAGPPAGGPGPAPDPDATRIA